MKPGDGVIYTDALGTEYLCEVVDCDATVGRNHVPAIRIYVFHYTEEERGRRRARGWSSVRPRVGRRRVTAARLRLVDKK